MSFFVVKTIEDEKVFITTVPANWCDEKTLYFPNSGDWKKLRINKIPPELDWRLDFCFGILIYLGNTNSQEK